MPDARPRPLVLIIEDTRDLVDLIRRRFSQAYEVEAALTGAEGIEKARSLVPDVVLLDVNLPDMSGFDVLAALKSGGPVSDVPVLMMTALSDTENVVAGFRLGAEDYIVKPFNFAELSARVGAHITIRRLQRQLIEVERLRMLRELAVSFNHEINNPLMSISVFAHVLKRRLDGTEECANSVDGILQEVGRIAESVKRLSEATRAATVDYQPGVRMIDIHDLG